MKKLIPLLLLLLTNSCNKFEHLDLTYYPTCDLCNFAESLNGTYRGYATGLGVDYEIPMVANSGDSVTMTVQQVFIGNSSIEDSTRMRFLTSITYDSWPPGNTPHTNIIEILRSDGFVEEGENKYKGLCVLGGEPQMYSHYFILSDSLDVRYVVKMGSAQYAMNLNAFKAVLYKM